MLHHLASGRGGQGGSPLKNDGQNKGTEQALLLSPSLARRNIEVIFSPRLWQDHAEPGKITEEDHRLQGKCAFGCLRGTELLGHPGGQCGVPQLPSDPFMSFLATVHRLQPLWE